MTSENSHVHTYLTLGLVILLSMHAGEILDIRTDAQTQLFLKHHRDSLKRIDFSDTPPVARKVFGSMRRSRQTPGAEANPHPGESWERKGQGRRLERVGPE